MDIISSAKLEKTHCRPDHPNDGKSISAATRRTNWTQITQTYLWASSQLLGISDKISVNQFGGKINGSVLNYPLNWTDKVELEKVGCN